jgi:predicted O-linked N-acetylglucosamine transferase (SPINDLY family)/glycosyltransferase involved in cell wall biosynthesis
MSSLKMMNCKICDTQSTFFFSTKVLNKYDVDYFQCPSCGFVQTEEPYWLEEAYNSPITASDIGILMRNEMLVQLAGNIIVTFFDHDAKFLDYGAGYGLFVRMMRDRGIDFSWNDQYCDNLFSKGFEGSLEKSYELLTSFEVFEHLVDPLATIEGLLKASKNILFSTELLPPNNPKADAWWYYSTHEGQHISIFTPKSLAAIADKFGLNLYSNGSFFHLLTEKNLDQQEFAKWSQYSPEGFGKPSLLQRDVVTLAEKRSSVHPSPVQEYENNSVVEREQPTIVIDGVFFQMFKTGIARVWSSLLKEWASSDFAKHIVVLDRMKSTPRIPGITYRDVRSYNYGDVEGDRKLLQSICDEENASLFISTYYTTPLTTASVFMAYDMIPEVMDWDLTHPMWRNKSHSINHASSYISISESTKKDLASIFPEVVDYPSLVSCLAFDATIFKQSTQEEMTRFQEEYSIAKPYFLLVGHPGGYKNGILLFKALSKLANRSQFDVICTCSLTELDSELCGSVDGYHVHLLKLSDDELRLAYSGAIALVYPSKYEGFGLPILEAMACSCPVITCALSSIPEVAGDAAIFVDPDDVDAMVDAIVKIQDSTVRQNLIRKGLIQSRKFSWDKTAGLITDRLLETAQISLVEQVEDHAVIEKMRPVIDAFAQSKSLGHLGDLSELRLARQSLANHYLSKSLGQLKVSHLGHLGDIHRELCKHQFLLGQLTETEARFVSSLSALFQSDSVELMLSAVLVSMMYQRSDRICRDIDTTKIPSWLLTDYIHYVCTAPPLFTQVGELSQHVAFMCDWLSQLNENIINYPGTDRWSDIAWMTLQRLKTFPLYFVEQNVKDYFVNRALLVECCLTSKGYNLPYQFPLVRRDENRIRLGVLASHFTPQSETFASLPIYKSLDRNKFEIILISVVQTGHRLERYCIGLADVDIQLPEGLTNRVTCIRELDLDILFFATNVTLVTDDMLLLASHRLARVQVTGMNSPTTTGLQSIDHYMSSAFVNPIFSVDDHYSEAIVSLESAAQCFDFATERFLDEGESICRDDFDISESSIVYCSGANFRKVTPELELSWAKIIAAVPNSVLMLYPFNPNWSDSCPIAAFHDRINQTFIDHGLDLSRLIILDAAPTRSQVMNRLTLADIYLDSYPFSGMTSLIDPLMLNMPTLVMEMDSACSLARGSAFLRELNAEELIVRDVQSYINLAVQLGQDVSFRSRMKDVIQLGMSHNPSFLNSDRYGEEISKAFHQMFDEYQSKQILNSLEIRDKNLIVFPDWNLDEDELFESMIIPVRSVVAGEDCEQTSLLVYIGDRDPEYADLLMTSVLMHLVSEEGIEIEGDGPQVEFLDRLGFLQQTKIAEIYSLVEFVGEDSEMIERFNVSLI